MIPVNKGRGRKPAVTAVIRDRVGLLEICAHRMIIGVFPSVPSPMRGPLLARHSIIDPMGALFGIVRDREIFRRRFQGLSSRSLVGRGWVVKGSARVLLSGELQYGKPAGTGCLRDLVCRRSPIVPGACAG